MAPKALIACANYWDSPIQVGDHHLARGLVERGYEVAFVSNPVSPFHLLGRGGSLRRARFRNYRRGGQQDLGGRLWSYSPGALVVPHRSRPFRNRWVLDHWHRTSVPSVSRKVEQQGFGEVDLLYIREAKQAFWLDAVRYKKLVYRVADRDSGFPGYQEQLRHLERKVAERADLVVYTAESLREYVEKLGARRTLHLPNGVDFDHFQAPDLAEPAPLSHIPTPRAVYVGSLDAWFDAELLARAARELPEVSFVVIGPESPHTEGLRSVSNVHVLGPCAFAELPAYLRHCHVGLIPFQVEAYRELIDSVNPIKLYEYLACGLPVVAVQWEELERLESPAVLCRDAADFVSAVGSQVERGGAPELREYARAHDWSLRVADLLEALETLGVES